jgi:TrpR family trp operon transcriptional repressor
MKDLIKVFTQIDDETQMRQFLEEIMTPGERHDLNMRWRLMQMLMDGIPQREIASRLHVSTCKITRGAKILKRKDSVSQQWLEKKG